MKAIRVRKQLKSLILMKTFLIVSMRHSNIGEKVTKNINIYISHYHLCFRAFKEAKEMEYFDFPSSNKVTEVDEHYFNIVRGEWILLEPETMTVNIEKMTANHGIMTSNHDKMNIISTHPGLTFSYHRVLMPKTVPEQGLGGVKYVVALRIRKLKVDSEGLL